MRWKSDHSAPWPSVLVVAFGLVTTGCGTSDKALLGPSGESGRISYQGTASVGDFLSITIDHSARTISYSNLSNGLSGDATYTVAADGGYNISDPTGNFIAGYEIPGYALVLEARRTGPDGMTPSLVFAILKETFRKSDITAASYNYMQFRTRGGGIEIGSTVLDGVGGIVVEGYGPLGQAFGFESFHNGSMSTDLLQEDPSGSYLFAQTEEDEAPTYVFRTQGGFLAVDTPNGSHICMKQQASKYFSPSWAGTYGAILYRKNNAWDGGGFVEHGEVSFDRATVTIGTNGNIAVVGEGDAPLASGMLIPVADNPDLTGPERLANTSPGLFYFSLESGSARQQVFATFIEGAILLASFEHDPGAIMSTGQYSYFYGAGLKR